MSLFVFSPEHRFECDVFDASEITTLLLLLLLIYCTKYRDILKIFIIIYIISLFELKFNYSLNYILLKLYYYAEIKSFLLIREYFNLPSHRKDCLRIYPFILFAFSSIFLPSYLIVAFATLFRLSSTLCQSAFNVFPLSSYPHP